MKFKNPNPTHYFLNLFFRLLKIAVNEVAVNFPKTVEASLKFKVTEARYGLYDQFCSRYS